MSVWDIDLTTRTGAQEATQTAAGACGLFALIFGYGLYRLGRMFDLPTVPIPIFVFAAFVLGTAALATWRFKADKGSWVGWIMLVALALLVVFAIAIAIALADGFSIFITIPIAAVCLVVGRFAFNGIRAARALGTHTRFDDDDVAVFE